MPVKETKEFVLVPKLITTTAEGTSEKVFPEVHLDKIADFMHQTWSSWMKHILESLKSKPRTEIRVVQGSKAKPEKYTVLIVGFSDFRRWKRQMETEFEDLPAEEQLLDVDIAEKFIGWITRE